MENSHVEEPKPRTCWDCSAQTDLRGSHAKDRGAAMEASRCLGTLTELGWLASTPGSDHALISQPPVT